MPHDIGPAPKHIYKKGDRIQHLKSGQFATVGEDQTDPHMIKINWDKYPGQFETYKADAFRIAPWHGINIKDYLPVDVQFDPALMTLTFSQARDIIADADPDKFYGGAVKADTVPKDADRFLYKKGDRVKFKFNRSTGTVAEDQPHYTSYVRVNWDQSGKLGVEHSDTLVPLHTPRDTDPANPNQEAIDAIEALRVPLKQEIEALQQKLGNLTTAKKILERG